MRNFSSYKKIIIDLGTGDGRFVYENAKQHPENFYIGIDPNKKQLEKYQKKINRKRLSNAVLTVGSVEHLPQSYIGIADVVYINFPWGSLLGGIATANENIIENINSLLKPEGNLEITFGYSQRAEPSEYKRLGLENLDERYIEEEVIKGFERGGFKNKSLETLSGKEMFGLKSSWSKKLSFGVRRNIFRLTLIKNK